MNTLGYVGLVGGPLNFERQDLLFGKFIGRLVWDLGFSWRFTGGSAWTFCPLGYLHLRLIFEYVK